MQDHRPDNGAGDLSGHVPVAATTTRPNDGPLCGAMRGLRKATRRSHANPSVFLLFPEPSMRTKGGHDLP